MTDSMSDDARLRATEVQMRRALGLKEGPQVGSEIARQPASPGAGHPQRRRFVRDGEVPVSVIHRDQDDRAGTNKLEATKQELQEQVAARGRVETLLREAEATIRDLHTKSAHDRLAWDEALQRLGEEKQIVEQALQRLQEELAVERNLRHKAEQERDEAIAARNDAETRAIRRTDGGDKPRPAKRRARPAEPDPSESEFVEWWKPGWRDRFR